MSGWLLMAALALGPQPLPSASDSAPAATQPADDPDAVALLERVSRHYAEQGALEGGFVQTYTNRALGHTLEERGRLLLAPPDRMRWEYLSPESKLFVATGGSGWFYLPEDGLAYRLELQGEVLRRLPTRLLSGDASIGDDYRVQMSVNEEDELRLTLTPRERRGDVERLELSFAPGSLELLAVELEDGLGNLTRFRFQELRPVPPPPAERFEFTPPDDVEIEVQG